MDLIGPHRTTEGPKSDGSAEPTKSQLKELPRPTSGLFDKTETDSEITSINLNTFTRRMTANTVRELDGLIDHLQSLRKKLLANGSRVEREIVDYTAMGQSVTELTKIVADSVSRLKTART